MDGFNCIKTYIPVNTTKYDMFMFRVYGEQTHSDFLRISAVTIEGWRGS